MNAARPRLVIFDFDGTLADSLPFFARVFNQLAGEHGFRTVDADTMEQLRHQSPRTVMRHVGMPAWKLPLVATSFTALMATHAHEIPLFPGVDALLRSLSTARITTAIVTSNAAANVSRILGPDNIGHVAHVDGGMSMFGKASRLRRLLRTTGTAPSEAIYVGDQVTDLQAARRVGLPFGAVAWGYAPLAALEAHRPDRVFRSIDELATLAHPNN